MNTTNLKLRVLSLFAATHEWLGPKGGAEELGFLPASSAWARLKAVQTAREKATAMAAQLGQAIGKPWEVTEQSDADGNELMTANVSFVHYKLPQQEATVAGGEVTIRALVRVSFLLE